MCKIAHIVMDFKPVIAGDGQVAYDMASELSTRGHDVTVLTCLPPYMLRSTPSTETENGFKIVRFPSIQTGLRLHLYDPYIRGLFSHLMTHPYDIIHCHSYHFFYSLQVSLLRRIKNFRLVVQTHHPWQYANLPFFNSIYRAIRDNHTRSILRSSDIILAVTPHDVDGIAHLGIDLQKVTVLPIGIYWNRYQGGNAKAFRSKYEIHEDEKIILFLGMLTQNKGIEFLVRSVAHLTKISKMSPKLVIAGRDGGVKAQIQCLIKDLGLKDRVVFTGGLSEEDKLNAFRACDVFVLPSSYEGFGLVLLEAQASGKPVVATRAGGMIYSVRDGETGFLVSYGAKKDLAGKIGKLLEDEQLNAKMGERGREFAKKFDYEILMPRLIEIYKSLL